MSNELDSIENQVSGGRNYDAPPLHLWHPDLSGDIDIQITADGSWYHEGEKISRQAIVRLFASILRREDDGEYYLVTPGEKWRITVDVHPLLVTDVSWGEATRQEPCKQPSIPVKPSISTGRTPCFWSPLWTI